MAAAWLGEVATDLRLLDRRVPVRVRLPDAFRFDPRGCRRRMIRGRRRRARAGVARWRTPERSNGQSELLRENLRQMALVSGRLEGRDLGSAVAEIKTRARSDIKLPVGYTLRRSAGSTQSQRQAFRELLMVFGIAAVLVFTDSGDPVPRVARRRC